VGFVKTGAEKAVLFDRKKRSYIYPCTVKLYGTFELKKRLDNVCLLCYGLHHVQSY
jgi:hypothetical protein